jgi:flagellar motor switch protein FliN/FliY
MAETIEYQQFEPPAAANGALPGGDVDLSRLSDIPMELSVEIGRTHMTVGETLDLRVGSVVALERLAGETADLLVNGTAIARGEVVVIDEQYGLRITEILDGHGEGELADAPAAQAARGATGGAPQAEPPDASGAEAEASQSQQPAAAQGAGTQGADTQGADTQGADTQGAGAEAGEGRPPDER